MKLHLVNICSTLLQSLSSVLCAVSLYLFLSIPAHAIHDTNQNGVSDLWERQNNSGNLIVDFDPTADPDGDGWTNEQEAITGTNPFDGNVPIGFLRPEIEHIPAVYITPEVDGGEPEILSPQTTTITSPTLVGKQYTLFASTDLSPGSWTTIGTPNIGSGTEMATAISLTQSDGSIPNKLFLRISVLDVDQDSDTLTNAEEAELGSSPYSADGDNDGLSDLEELFTYQTSPVSRDSDGDGVSDPDEILVNFTNPLTATDADGDGIPDDFEKHFANQLLAYQPDVTYWGVYHAGLLAGNLDANHDYTGDGMNVRELAEILKKIPAGGPADSGYLVEQQERHNSLQWAYYYPPSSSSTSEGTYLHSVPDDYDVRESMTPTADLSSQYLLSRIDGVAWSRSYITSGDRMGFSNGRVESAFRRTPTPELSSNGTKFQGIISQQRCRLIATHPGHEEYSRNYLKVIENSNYFNYDYTGVITVEPFTVQFPKGRMLSDWYEFKAPIVDESEGRSAELQLLQAEVVPDYNRDGKINQADRGKVTAETPWKWWVNDDDDIDSATGGDIPGSNSPDHSNGHVDGMRDLIDFFPIYLDIQSALSTLPKDQYQYFIKHSDGGFNFFEIPAGEPDPAEDNLSMSPNSHFTNIIRGVGLASHAVTSISSAGVQLSNNYLTQAENGKGLLLLEATKETTAPLQLEIRKGTQVFATLDFPVKISKVEAMFRHVDLTQVPRNYDGSSPGAASAPNGTRTDDPGDPYPDALTNGKYFVFLHGFNVPVQRARGWNAEVFKRMHQMGSKARFVGVTWTGATGIPNVITDIGNAESSTDYHKAVYFALQTGRALNTSLNFTNGADLTIAAHSLGNMVVSQAIENGGLVPNRYYIINGAVAREAYDATVATTAENLAMTEHDSKPYGAIGQQRLYAANWHDLFDSGDSRSKLTWKDHFGKVSLSKHAHNFYSPGDDVVQNPQADTAVGGIAAAGVSRGAWANQELMKGTALASIVQTRRQGGWGFHYNPPTGPGTGTPIDPWTLGYYKYDGFLGPLTNSFRKYTPEEARDEITDAQLKDKPFFRPFLERELFDPALGSAKAAETKVQEDVLACGVPSMSYAIAVNPVSSLAGNHDMEAMKTWPDSWPSENHGEILSVGRWLHSDFRDVAINYLHKMYKQMIDLGELNQ